MADFLNDYSGIAAAGEGFKSFAQAYQDAQDRQVKKQESQAKINAMNAQMDRDAQDQALKLRGFGAKKNKVTGELEDAPISLKAQNDQAVGIAEKGLNPLEYDEKGVVKPPTWNPQSPQIIAAKARQTTADNKGIGAGTKEDDKHNADWEKFATAINNPSSRATLGRYQQQLDKAGTLNALANQIGVPEGGQPPANETPAQREARFNKADSRQLYEFAKSADQLISAGQSTMYGTEHLMPKDMQIGASKIAEWASGSPIPANAGSFINRYLDSANRENKYFQGKRDASVAGVAAGYKHLKKLDPDRWEEVMRSTAAQQDAPQAPQQSPAVAPQGLVEKPQGFLSKAAGLLGIGGGQSPAAPAPQQDPDVAAYAKQYGLDYAHAAAIIANRKAKVSAN